jgi:spore germination protein KB
MIEKGKISAMQLAMMMYPMVLGTAVLVLPGIIAKYAKNDLWLSTIFASLAGFLTVYIANRLHRLFPKETIIQYSQRILGTFAGKALGVIYMLFYVHITGIVAREYADFLVSMFLPLTPTSVVITLMVLVAAMAVRGGVEVVGRTAVVFFPVFTLPLILFVVMLFNDLDPRNLLPVMEHGITPVIKGASVPQTWFSEFFLISFFLPMLTDSEKGMKWGMASVTGVMLTMVLVNLIALFLFGQDIATFTYPVMEVARYISVADFFENLQSVIMMLWVLGAFVKISLFYYAVALGTAQWLNLSDYRPLVLPLGFLIFLFSFWDLPNLSVLNHFQEKTGPFYLISIQIVIPLLLLIIAVVRRRSRNVKEV